MICDLSPIGSEIRLIKCLKKQLTAVIILDQSPVQSLELTYSKCGLQTSTGVQWGCLFFFFFFFFLLFKYSCLHFPSNTFPCPTTRVSV